MKLLKSLPKDFPLDSNVQILSVFHLLETSISFFETIRQVADLKSIIAIPYSAEDKVIEKYKTKFSETSFIIPKTIDEIQNIIIAEYTKLTKDKPIIIIEVGGYSASILDTLQKINSNLIGIVEDTNQGHWNYEKMGNDLTVPVYSIAQSKIKSLENRLIGKAIVFSVEDILRKSFYKTICGLNITILGYGKIGKSAVRSLRNRDAIIKVWDINPINRFQARLDGYFCPKTKKEALINTDIILGVSGKNSVLFEDIKYLKNNTILVSGSSKDIEFKYDELIKLSDKNYINNDDSNNLIFNEKTITFINSGRPVNFLNNSVLSSVLELIFAELYICVYTLLKNPSNIGIHQIDNKFHVLLCDKWEEYYLNSAYETV